MKRKKREREHNEKNDKKNIYQKMNLCYKKEGADEKTRDRRMKAMNYLCYAKKQNCEKYATLPLFHHNLFINSSSYFRMFRARKVENNDEKYIPFDEYP